MDKSWNLSKWRASLFGVLDMPRPVNLEGLSHSVRATTLSLQKLYMDPELWLLRSSLLKQAGFPELAIGDAYKAKLLIEALCQGTGRTSDGEEAMIYWGMRKWLEDQNDPKLAQTWSDPVTLGLRITRMLQELRLKIFIALTDSLFMASCFWDCLSLVKEARKDFPDDEELKSILNDAHNMMNKKLKMERPPGMSEEQFISSVRGGQVAVVPYPWMTPEHLSRDSAMMASLTSSLEKKTNLCQLKPRSSPATNRGGDSYGIYASTKIPRGRVALVDPPMVTASTYPRACPVCAVEMEAPDGKKKRFPGHDVQGCQVEFCTEGCADKALRSFHLPMCRRDLSHLDATPSNLTVDEELSLKQLTKILAWVIEERCAQPLLSSVVGHLQPHYITGYFPLNLKKTYELPFRTLKALGINIFRDFRFDFWIIHTIRCRVINNGRQIAFGKSTCNALNEHQTLFNHSCEPNVRQEIVATDMSTQSYIALRDIQKGEELCVSYLDEEFFFRADVNERQELLRPWFASPCWCRRCKRERK